MNTNLTLAEVITAANTFSVADRRAIKVALNVSIKADAAVTKLDKTLTKEATAAANRAAGLAYIKTTPIGSTITVATADGVYNMEIKGINFEKSTVSGFKLDDAGAKILGENGKPVTAWRYFENIVLAPVTANSSDDSVIAEEVDADADEE